MKSLYYQLLTYFSKLKLYVFIKYAIAGVISAAIEFTLLLILVEKAKINYLVANMISFVITNIINYLLSRLWVFGKSDKLISVEATLFFIITSIGLLVNQVIMWYLTDRHHLDYRLSKIIAIVAVVGWNFAGRKFFVFTSTLKNKNA